MSADEGFQHISERQRAEGRVVTGDAEQRGHSWNPPRQGGPRKRLQAETGVGVGVPQGRRGKCGWKWD